MLKIKKKFHILSFAIFFILGGILGTVTYADTWSISCSVPNGTTVNCLNSGTGTNDLTNFTHKMYDKATATSAYKLKFTMTEFKPSVTRGAPVYQNYVIYDNKNATHYTYNNHNGKFLNDYSSLVIGTNVTTDYYPASGERPMTTLYLKSGDATDCYTKPWACISYNQVTQFDIK
jgi:hypothetical protein